MGDVVALAFFIRPDAVAELAEVAAPPSKSATLNNTYPAFWPSYFARAYVEPATSECDRCPLAYPSAKPVKRRL